MPWAPRITNFPEWRSHLIARLRHQIYVTADPIPKQLMSEILSYPMPRKAAKPGPDCEEYAGVVVPLQLSTEDGTLSFLVRRPCLEHRSILHWRSLLLSLSFRQTPRPQRPYIAWRGERERMTNNRSQKLTALRRRSADASSSNSTWWQKGFTKRSSSRRDQFCQTTALSD